MVELDIAPGPAAGQAFRLGLLAGAVLGLGGIGLVYWSGALPPVGIGYMLLVLFPVYLVLVAAVLSRWLGYGKDASSLRPVTRSGGSE